MLCNKAYQVLRRNVDKLTTLFKIMICTGMPELDEKTIRFLEGSLALNMDRESSENYLYEKLEESINSLSTRLNFAIHVIAN